MVIINTGRADAALPAQQGRATYACCIGMRRVCVRNAGMAAGGRSTVVHWPAATAKAGAFLLLCSQALEYEKFDKFDRKRWPQVRC